MLHQTATSLLFACCCCTSSGKHTTCVSMTLPDEALCTLIVMPALSVLYTTHMNLPSGLQSWLLIRLALHVFSTKTT